MSDTDLIILGMAGLVLLMGYLVGCMAVYLMVVHTLEGGMANGCGIDTGIASEQALTPVVVLEPGHAQHVPHSVEAECARLNSATAPAPETVE
jgi:hypothetical protein